MGKPFNLRVKPTSKSRCSVLRDVIDLKSKQIEEAVEWCRINNKRGWAAINTGKFPLVKDLRTINKRLDGVVETGKEKEYCTIFTTEEEESIVCYIKNKNR